MRFAGIAELGGVRVAGFQIPKGLATATLTEVDGMLSLTTPPLLPEAREEYLKARDALLKGKR